MYSTWSITDSSDTHAACMPTTARVKPGYYTLDCVHGTPVIKELHVKTDAICPAATAAMAAVRDEIAMFWNSADKYAQMHVAYKRGLLLYGPAGCGKSSIVTQCVKDHIAADGIAIRAPYSCEMFKDLLAAVREIEGEQRKILLVFEDIERCCRYDEEELLELLDGVTTIGNGILVLATTNKLMALPERIRCRPSRIDTLQYVGLPELAECVEYVRFLLSAYAMPVDDAQILRIAEAAASKLSSAQLKELVLAIYVYGAEIDATIQRLLGKHAGATDNTDDDDDDDDYDD